MKDIKQIRESYLVLEKEDAEQKKLTTLVRAGLFDAKKLPMLKRALKKDVTNMTPAEKNLLVDLLDNLMAQVLHSQQVYMKVRTNVAKKDMEELKEASDYLTKFDPRVKPGYSDKTDRQIPAVLILKRKAIRVYPDNQKVALYYAQALDQYVTIPFGLEDTSGPASIKEDTDTYSDLPSAYNTREHQDRVKEIARLSTLGKKRTPDDAAKLAQLVRTHKKSLQNLSRKGEAGGAKATGLEAKDKAQITAVSDIAKRKEQRNKDLLAPVGAGWEGVGELIGRAVRAPIQKIGGAVRDRRAMKNIFKEESDIKSRFKTKLNEKREEQLDEALPLLALGALAARAAPVIARTASAAKKGYDTFKAARAARKAAQMRRAARNARAGGGAGAAAGAAAGSMLGGGGDDGGPSAGEATAKSLGPVQAKEYQFQGGLAGGKMGAPGTRDIQSSTRQGDFRSPADQVKYLNAMMRESVDNIQVAFGEETVTINNNTAQKVLEVHNSLNEENRNKFETMLNESPTSFRKAVNFALRY